MRLGPARIVWGFLARGAQQQGEQKQAAVGQSEGCSDGDEGESESGHGYQCSGFLNCTQARCCFFRRSLARAGSVLIFACQAIRVLMVSLTPP